MRPGPLASLALEALSIASPKLTPLGQFTLYRSVSFGSVDSATGAANSANVESRRGEVSFTNWCFMSIGTSSTNYGTGLLNGRGSFGFRRAACHGVVQIQSLSRAAGPT